MMVFATSVLLNQTRSIWLSAALTFPVLVTFFASPGDRRHYKAISQLLVFTALVALIFYFVVPNVDLADLVTQRISTLTDQDNRLETTITRSIALEREIQEWAQGNWLLGRGLFYFGPIYFEPIIGELTVAWGHLGHVTVLAQLGLVGLFIYSIYLPVTVLISARTLRQSHDEIHRYWSLLAAACAISTWIMFFMSDSFLMPHAVEGIIFGAAWRLARRYRAKHESPTMSRSNKGVASLG
jgi:hypothetical protein